jgi:hypothetical protein
MHIKVLRLGIIFILALNLLWGQGEVKYVNCFFTGETSQSLQLDWLIFKGEGKAKVGKSLRCNLIPNCSEEEGDQFSNLEVSLAKAAWQNIQNMRERKREQYNRNPGDLSAKLMVIKDQEYLLKLEGASIESLRFGSLRLYDEQGQFSRNIGTFQKKDLSQLNLRFKHYEIPFKLEISTDSGFL